MFIPRCVRGIKSKAGVATEHFKSNLLPSLPSLLSKKLHLNSARLIIEKRYYAAVVIPPPPSSSSSPQDSSTDDKGDKLGTLKSNINIDEASRKTSIDAILGLDASKVSYTGSESKVQKVNGFQKIRQMWKQYGLAAMGTYFCLYWGTLGSVFVLIDNEIISATVFGFESNEECVHIAMQKVSDLIESATGTGLSESFKSDPSYGKFVMSLFITELTDPIRIGATLFIVPKIAKDKTVLEKDTKGV